MKFNEFDLEQAIWDDYVKTKGAEVAKRGLFLQPVMKRQVRIGNYGIADLVGFEVEPDGIVRHIQPTIYELKQNKINDESFFQALNYANGLYFLTDKTILFPKIVLIGSSVGNSNSFCYLPNFTDRVEFYTVSIGVDGLSFVEESNYSLVDGGAMNEKLTFSDYKKMLLS